MDNKKEKKELFTTGKQLKNTCALISHSIDRLLYR
jgi:hypothetical protein